MSNGSIWSRVCVSAMREPEDGSPGLTRSTRFTFIMDTGIIQGCSRVTVKMWVSHCARARLFECKPLVEIETVRTSGLFHCHDSSTADDRIQSLQGVPIGRPRSRSKSRSELWNDRGAALIYHHLLFIFHKIATMELGANFAQKLEPFMLMSKSAKGAAAAKLIQDVTAAPGVFVFAELFDLPNIQEVWPESWFKFDSCLICLP